MNAATVLPFAPAAPDVATVQGAPVTTPPTAPIQRRLFYDPPPSARPLRLVHPRPMDVGACDPMDRVRDRPDGSTVAVRVQRAPFGAPAAWSVRIIVTPSAAVAVNPSAVASRTLYAPTASAAVFAQAAVMQALDAAYQAAAERNPAPVLSILRPDEDEPRASAPRSRDGQGRDGAPTLAAG